MDIIRVLHLSTHNEECGIAKYQQHVVDGMAKHKEVHNVFFEVSPNKIKSMKGAELEAVIAKLVEQMAGFDILHIQHEYSFYLGTELHEIVARVKDAGKKVMFTVHTAPHAHVEYNPPVLGGIGLRHAVHYLRTKQRYSRFMHNHIEPMTMADLIVTPNQTTKDSLVAAGVSADKIEIIEHPIPVVDTTKKSTRIAAELQKREGDVIYSTVGFLSEAKGILHAVKALVFLPKNYKLAIIGGSHPSGLTDEFYDAVCDTIQALGLVDRVYITGYIKDDADMDALIREADICVYAYNKKYYGYVSSAALSTAISNKKPVVAYPTPSLLETNTKVPFISFCQSANYYELARTLRQVDIAKSTQQTIAYAQAFSAEAQGELFIKSYQELLGKA